MTLIVSWGGGSCVLPNLACCACTLCHLPACRCRRQHGPCASALQRQQPHAVREVLGNKQLLAHCPANNPRFAFNAAVLTMEWSSKGITLVCTQTTCRAQTQQLLSDKPVPLRRALPAPHLGYPAIISGSVMMLSTSEEYIALMKWPAQASGWPRQRIGRGPLKWQ